MHNVLGLTSDYYTLSEYTSVHVQRSTCTVPCLCFYFNLFFIYIVVHVPTVTVQTRGTFILIIWDIWQFKFWSWTPFHNDHSFLSFMTIQQWQSGNVQRRVLGKTDTQISYGKHCSCLYIPGNQGYLVGNCSFKLTPAIQDLKPTHWNNPSLTEPCLTLELKT